MRFGRWLYDGLMKAGCLVASPYLLTRAAFSPSWRRDLFERFSVFQSSIDNPHGGASLQDPSQRERQSSISPIWFHAASVGEATSLIPLAKGVFERWPTIPLAITTMTVAGRRVLEEHCSTPHTHALAPIDTSGSVSRRIQAWRPRALVIAETELWPNMIRGVRSAGARVVMVNGRISERSFRRYRWARSMVKPLLESVEGFGMSTEIDAFRITELGAPAHRVLVLGHSKFDHDWDEAVQHQSFTHELRRKMTGRMAITAGSTRESEEEILLEAMGIVWKKFPKALLIVAPRHMERLPEVEALLHQRGCRWVKRSQWGPSMDRVQVLLLDTLGELAACYSVSHAAFVGGTLAPIGGHNLLEPAAWSIPVTFGPHVANVQIVAEALIAGHGGVMVQKAEELGSVWLRWLESSKHRMQWGQAAREVLRAQQGSTERTLDFLGQTLQLKS